MITIDCSNLISEMTKKEISFHEIAILLGKSEEAVSSKMHGETEWIYEEVVQIRNVMFPEYDLGYLFHPQNM